MEAAERERTASRSGRAVRVTLPVRVAYDATALKKGIANLMEQLGCPKCFSGTDCRFQTERDFVINQKLEVVGLNPQPLPPLAEPDPHPWRHAKSQVTISTDRTIHHDLERVFLAIDRVIGKLGHQACFSGFDPVFQDEIEQVMHVNRNLEVVQF